MANNGQRRSKQGHSNQRRPTQAHQGQRWPPTANAGSQQPTKANDGQRRPMKVNAGPQQPTKANAGPPRPTAAHEGPQQPMKAHSSQPRPTTATDGQCSILLRQVCLCSFLIFFFQLTYVLIYDRLYVLLMLQGQGWDMQGIFFVSIIFVTPPWHCSNENIYIYIVCKLGENTVLSQVHGVIQCKLCIKRPEYGIDGSRYTAVS